MSGHPVSDPWIAAASLSTATLHEAAGRAGALPAAIKPLSAALGLCGRALPVRGPAGDNLWLHRAIHAARRGDVLVVDPEGEREYGYWGEVMAIAAIERGIAGLVINGGVRDSRRLIELGFPVFSAGVCIRGTSKRADGTGSIGAPIRIGTVTVHRDDLIVGDADGVVVIAEANVIDVVAEARQRDADEQTLFGRLRAGESTLSIYTLPGGETWSR